MDISLQLSMLLWISICISMDVYGYSCMDLLWILVLGIINKPINNVQKTSVTANLVIEILKYLA